MDKLFKHLETPSLLLGRTLLGLYFAFFGMRKISSYEAMTQYMDNYDVPFVAVLLPLTILIQVLFGICLIVGFKAKYAAFILAGLTLMINLFMHSFWNLPDGANLAHETQNFVKNTGIIAGLLILSARGSGQFSLDNWLQNRKTS
ncbi:DoxX family protein [Glaciecola sp. SC05]|uniref:DoxX family protein n=1 Tax=Glaciecola sp. SC05 TaxID=1987355 RepID=UPI0035281015